MTKKNCNAIQSDNANLCIGHRARLRKRFMTAGPSSIEDHELLEMLLGIAQPRKDTKILAKKLLSIFGDFNGVIGSNISQIKSIDGIGEISITILKLIHESVCRMLKKQIINKTLIDSWDKVMEYCRARLGYEAKESNIVLFLNTKNFLIDSEMRFEGTVDHAHTYPREIIAKALELGAKAIIMVHNHPGGDPTPSQQDLDITQNIKQIASLMNIRLHDHIIVSKNSCYSLKEHGQI